MWLADVRGLVKISELALVEHIIVYLMSSYGWS